MSRKFPALQNDPARFISLAEAFGRTGCFMYPNDWIGREGFAWRGKELSPDGLKAERRELEARFSRAIEAEERFLHFNTNDMSETEYAEFQSKYKAAKQASIHARMERDQFGETFDYRFSNAAEFQRRTEVERKITNAIVDGELTLFPIPTGLSVSQWRDDLRHEHLELQFSYSLLVLRDKHSESSDIERHTVGFLRDDFDAWAAQCELAAMEYRGDRIEYRVLDWFRAYQANELINDRKPKKKPSQMACEATFPEHDVVSLFNAAWALFADPALKRPGYR